MYVKTASDYRSDLKAARLALMKVENQITFRIVELCNRNPDVIVRAFGTIPCRSGQLVTDNFIGQLSTNTKVDIILEIEKILEDQQAVTQQILPFES